MGYENPFDCVVYYKWCAYAPVFIASATINNTTPDRGQEGSRNNTKYATQFNRLFSTSWPPRIWWFLFVKYRRLKMRSIFYTLIAALAITHGAMAYDGYNIPCSYGGGGNCICDVGSCQDYSWNDSPETFMCGSAKGDSGKCSCVDAQYNKTIEFPCGCTSDSGVYGTTATGSTAGPDRPPVFIFKTGRRVLVSMRIPRRVLMRDRASAPASSAARAISVMSVTLGESLTITGTCPACRFASRVTSAASSGRVP